MGWDLSFIPGRGGDFLRSGRRYLIFSYEWKKWWCFLQDHVGRWRMDGCPVGGR